MLISVVGRYYFSKTMTLLALAADMRTVQHHRGCDHQAHPRPRHCPNATLRRYSRVSCEVGSILRWCSRAGRHGKSPRSREIWGAGRQGEQTTTATPPTAAVMPQKPTSSACLATRWSARNRQKKRQQPRQQQKRQSRKHKLWLLRLGRQRRRGRVRLQKGHHQRLQNGHHQLSPPRPAAAVPAAIAGLRPKMPKRVEGAPPVLYNGGCIYSSWPRQSYRIIRTAGDYFSECSNKWTDDQAADWAKALGRIDEARANE